MERFGRRINTRSQLGSCDRLDGLEQIDKVHWTPTTPSAHHRRHQVDAPLNPRRFVHRTARLRPRMLHL